MLARKRERDVATHRVTYENGRSGVELLEQGMDVVCELCHRRAGSLPNACGGTLAQAAQVRGNHAVGSLERVHLLLPRAPGQRKAVDEHKRHALPLVAIHYLNTVNRCLHRIASG